MPLLHNESSPLMELIQSRCRGFSRGPLGQGT